MDESSVKELKDLLRDPAVNVNCNSKGGLTPLLLLCRHPNASHHTALDALLKQTGIDIDCVDKEGCTALIRVLKFFKHRLSEANMASRLIGSDAQVDGTTNEGKTVLRIACQKIKVKMLLCFVKRLIRAGANVGARDNLGLTALDMLIQRNHSTPLSDHKTLRDLLSGNK